MQHFKAQIVIDKTRDGFKAIVEHENSTRKFHPSYPNNKEKKVVQKASNEKLFTALFSIGVRLITERYEENIEMIAKHFKHELVTQTNLCWNEVDNDGFYEIF